MSYADITVRDPNPIKRWLQGRRFSDALLALKIVPPAQGAVHVLDFGAGNGELIRRMAANTSLEATAYEPTPDLMAEAKVNLASVPSVCFVEDLRGVRSESFDYIFCLEVFEHLPPAETAKAIGDLHRLLKPGGIAVVGVPHELFLPALLKGLFRMTRRYGEFDALPRNVLAALFGRLPRERPTGEIAPGVAYHFLHLGFDYRVLEKALQERFQIVKKWFSPFPLLGRALNSEVYFLLRRV